MILFVFILAGLIFIHELGHYLAARACGIPVKVFSLGMGKTVLSKRLFNTEWRLCVLPIGGYIIVGDIDNPTEILEEVFYSIHPVKRAIVALAGPFTNLALPFLLFFAAFTYGAGPAKQVGLFSLDGQTAYTASPSGAAKYAYDATTTIYTITKEGLEDLFKSEVPLKDQVGGPIMLYRETQHIKQFSEETENPFILLHWISFISVNLGFINLLPVPILDGGHVFTSVAEIAKRGPLPKAFLKRLAQAGLLFVITLISFTLYADVSRLF